MSSKVSYTNRYSALRLLGFAEWLRQQRWLLLFYRCLPLALRLRVAVWLTARTQARLRFPRTSAWTVSVPDGVGIVAQGGGGGCMNSQAGVNLLGYIRGQFGLGESARAYARALIGVGVPVSLYDVNIDLAHGWGDHSMDAWISEELPYSTNLVFINPDSWQSAMEKIGHARLRDRRVIACWFWELERVPDEWIAVIDEVDALIVATQYIEQSLRRVTDTPIFRIPYPLSDIVESDLQREDFGLEDEKFVFLNSFDFSSSLARKNPIAAIHAFIKAFPENRDDVRLLIKSSNGFRHPEKLRALLSAASADDRIIVRDDVIERAHIKALQRCCDVYVSLHRAEGLGLGLAECMAQGKPVIATAWSGNMEFMDETNSCLVDYRFIDVETGGYHAADGQRWADPDIDMAAAWMQRLVDEPGLMQSIGARAREVSLKLSPTRAGAELVMRLASIGPTQKQVSL